MEYRNAATLTPRCTILIKLPCLFSCLCSFSLSSHTGAKIYCLLLSLHGKKVLFPSFTFPLSLPLQDKWQHISCVCIHTRRVVYSGCSPRLFVSGDSVRRQRPVFITLRPAYFKLSISFIGALAWPIFGKQCELSAEKKTHPMFSSICLYHVFVPIFTKSS
jgi:hypothetical protein